MLTAVARDLHREEPPPWVIDDYLALALAGEEGPAIRDRLRAEMPPAGLLSFCRWVCVRARFPEDVVEQGLGNGIQQYVVLGAGLDSFAYRRRDLEDRLRIFEVDQPASQAWKRQRLAVLGLEEPPNLVFAPIDFETQTLREGLEQAGFDFGRPAIFSWIGVTMYLTLDAIRATLSTIAECAPGSRVVLTYNLPRPALQALGAEVEAVLARVASEMGEPFVSLFVPEDAERLLRDIGFVNIVHVGPAEAVATYFPGRADVRFGGAQRLIAGAVP